VGKCHLAIVNHVSESQPEAYRGPVSKGTDWCQSGSDWRTKPLYQVISCRYTEEAIGIAYRG